MRFRGPLADSYPAAVALVVFALIAAVPPLVVGCSASKMPWTAVTMATRPHPVQGTSGTFARSSLSQAADEPSLGARQSPRGDSEPPVPTFGAFGIAERLN
jgi:hypothetical protein